ncbi:hypothetical protein AU189_13430 [Mycolicibacterium acapulense]|nr:hypothetical protein AU189_13430 [Mycolicibacterium acapulense]
MTDETNTDDPQWADLPTPEDQETEAAEPTTEESDPDSHPDEPESFPREVVEKLRQENGKYRQRAQQADAYAKRLHTELVRATGRLADPSDLEFNPEHLDDPDALAAAVDELLAAKPHLASRKPVGDIGQGRRGTSAEPFSLLQMLKERT